VEYGFIDVVATSLDEAMEKVESFDGDYYVNKNTITHTELIEVLDN
jgi:recombinational DNA repair protein RecR